MSAHATTDTTQTAFSFSFETIEGDALPLSQFEGRVLLVVNTASRCGFTPNMTACRLSGKNIVIKAL